MSHKENQLSILDANQVLKDSHNEEHHALDVIDSSSLVPHKFGKIDLTYNADETVATAKYYSIGQCKESTLITRGDSLGSAELTKVNFLDTVASSIEGKFFIMYDNVGSVGIRFDMDNGSILPATGALRDIDIDIAFNDSPSMLAFKFSTAIDADAQFICISGGTLAIASSISIGNKTDSYDFNTGLDITSVDGTSVSTLNNQYYFVWAGNDSIAYYVWHNTSGAGVDPMILGKTGIMVPLITGDSDEVVAAANATALNATGQFYAYNEGSKLYIRALYPGVTSNSIDATTGFQYFYEKEPGINRTLLRTLIMTYDANSNWLTTEAI